jgi:hypothetical protein
VANNRLDFKVATPPFGRFLLRCLFVTGMTLTTALHLAPPPSFPALAKAGLITFHLISMMPPPEARRELPRISIPRTPVNKSDEKGPRLLYAPT